MFNFNLPKKQELSKERQKTIDLYKILFPQKEIPGDFIDICHDIYTGLNELPDHIVLDKDLKNNIKDVIFYIVDDLRKASEYGTEIDEKKKTIILGFESIAHEYFDSLKSPEHIDDGSHMALIENAWRQERGNNL